MKKTILNTGASRGFGKIWAEAFLKRGYNVIATSRNLTDLKDFRLCRCSSPENRSCIRHLTIIKEL